MNKASTWIALGALAAVVSGGAAPASAQAVQAPMQAIDAPALAGNDNAPWNHNVAIETRQSARELFLEGNRLFRVPLFARATEKYHEALRKWQHPAFYFNLALAQLNLGEELGAHDALEVAIRDGDGLIGVGQIQEARRQLQDLERRLARLRIRCALPGAEVTMDGASLFTGPGSYEGWVEPKVHQITAKKAEYLSEERRVKPAPGKPQDIELKLVTLEEAGDSGRRWAKWKPWTVAAGGAALAAAAGALHAVAARSFRSYDTDFLKLPCSSGGCSRDQIGPALAARLHRAGLQQRIAVGGYVAGGSLVAAGIALLYLNRPRFVESGPIALEGGLSFAPITSPDFVGVAFTFTQ